MKTFRISRISKIAAALAAGTVVIAAGGALAKGNNGGSHDHSSDHSQMKSGHSDKHSALRDVSKSAKKSADMRSDKHKDKESKHAEKMKGAKEEKRAEKMKEKEAKQAEKDKTTGTTTNTGTTTTTGTATTANGGLLVDRGVVGPTSTGIKPVPGTPAPGATPGPTAVNTIHPIPSPTAPVTVGSGNGIVRVTDRNGNSIIIPDHGTGVAVTPAGPGKVTISNGSDSRTVSAIDVTISGAKTVSVDKSLETGPRRADGSVNVLTPSGTVTGGPDPNALGGLAGFLTGGGFEAHVPAPEAGTSTVQQQ